MRRTRWLFTLVNSFQSLQEKLLSYEMENFVKLWIRIRDPLLLHKEEWRGNSEKKSDYRYYELTYGCIHGGKKFKPRRKRARQTSLVELLILNSYKNHAKVKIASKNSHYLMRCSAKSRSKAANKRWGVLQEVAHQIL